MTSSIRALLTTVLLTLGIISSAYAAERSDDDRDRLFQERTYQGKPLTFWLKALRTRDEDNISEAFNAIRSLGDDAWIAVPDLSRIVGAPFEPIAIGRDSMDKLASKLYDISIRSEAIDTLGWIGERAAPAAVALVKWALAERISMNIKRSPDNDEVFIELVAMDAEQRMRVAGAVAQLGHDTIPITANLLASSDASRRKLAIAILSQDALPVATDLLRSDICDDRQLGLQILKDMDLVVARPQIDELARRIAENCAALTKLH